jgi:hypothetical protein
MDNGKTGLIRVSVLFICFLSHFNSHAQQTNPKSVFVSANIGLFDVAQSQFEKVYDSNLAFLPEIAIGLPVSTRTYIYGKASYFSKNGVPVTYSYKIQNGGLILSSESKSGIAEFREWLFNTGLLVNCILYCFPLLK